jgi:hypothetical protein
MQLLVDARQGKEGDTHRPSLEVLQALAGTAGASSHWFTSLKQSASRDAGV